MVRGVIGASDDAGGTGGCPAIDAAAVTATFAEVRAAHGPIRGLIHGAGVLADKLIEQKTEEQFDLVYGTKVHGLRNLLAATAQDELRLIALFSSYTGRFGRTGQVDYAAANEVLNKIAQQQSRAFAAFAEHLRQTPAEKPAGSGNQNRQCRYRRDA